MIRIAGLAIAASLAAVPAHSADWKQLAESPTRTLSIDASSVRREGPQASFQYRFDAKEPQTNAVTGKTYRSTVIDMTINCAEGTSDMRHLRAFSELEGKGQLVDQVALNGGPKAIASGSGEDLLRKAACPAK